jgi:hypothetical protein
MSFERQQVSMEPWLRAAAINIEVQKEIERSPQNPRHDTLDDWVYMVEVNNGEGGMDGMGRTVCRCMNQEDAVMIAEALKRMASEDPDE